MLSTCHKIQIARTLSCLVLTVRRLFGRSSEVVVVRRGVTWLLNLEEGIDFAIFLLGGFEIRTLRRYAKIIREGDIVLDIGANVGAHALPLAQLVGTSGKVISFEPTAYAFAKQEANIALNPHLTSRIESHQLMLVSSKESTLPAAVYSSWPLESANDLHGEHLGRLMSTQGARKGTLDDFLLDARISRVDFVKLDVDGNEADVLDGARQMLAISRPRIMLELAPYVYRQNPARFDALLQKLWNAGYEITDVATKRQLPHDPAKVRTMIPDGGGMNALASYTAKSH